MKSFLQALKAGKKLEKFDFYNLSEQQETSEILVDTDDEDSEAAGTSNDQKVVESNRPSQSSDHGMEAV